MSMNVTKRVLSLLIALLITLGTLPVASVSAETLYLCEVTAIVAQYDADTETMTYYGTYDGELQASRTYVFFLNNQKGNLTISNVVGSQLDLGNGKFRYSFHFSDAETANLANLYVELRCNDNNVIKPCTASVVPTAHRLTFVANVGGSLVGETSIAVADGAVLSAIPYPTPVADQGYVFDGWTYTLGTVNSDMTLTASFVKDDSLWTKVVFTCGVGGVLDGEAEVNALLGTDFDSVAVPTPVANNGYVFAGWDKSFPDTVTDGLTFNASFDYVGDVLLAFSVSSASYSNGYVTVKGTAPLFEDGWDMAFRLVDGDNRSIVTMSTVKYSVIKTDGGYEYSFKVNPADIKDNMYVSVKPVSVPLAPIEKALGILNYTVTFVDYDGTVLETQTVEHGGSAVAPADPAREGYIFMGWDKGFDNVTSDLTVTALYDVILYTVVFVDYDGTVLLTQTVAHGDSAIAPAEPYREGYDFTGWDKEFDNVTADITVTAVYEIKTYTVTFVDYDGSVLSTETVEHGSAATAPAEPARDNHIFLGWDGDYSFIKDNSTFTALYAPIKYTVSFATEGKGEILGDSSAEIAFGTAFSDIALPEVSADAGYVFAGWEIPDGTVSENAVITARFILLGDVNGDGNVDHLDSCYILRYDAGLTVLTGDALIAADVTGEGKVTALDAAFILRYDAGLMERLG